MIKDSHKGMIKGKSHNDVIKKSQNEVIKSALKMRSHINILKWEKHTM